MEAILLAGGKAVRLGEAARGRPKALARVSGHTLAEYLVARLAAAGVTRVIVSCASGQEELFRTELVGLGADVACAAEDEPLGRGGGLRLAASHRVERGPVYALNGDDLHDVDFESLLAVHRENGAAATLAVARMTSSFGVVDVDRDNRITAFREAPQLPYWMNAGVYVLDEEALARLPERGDHERSLFPDLASEGKLRAFKHEGFWLPINTPKDLQHAEAYIETHPELRPTAT